MPLTNAERHKKYRKKLKANDESLYKAKKSKRKEKQLLNDEKVWKADRAQKQKYWFKKAAKNVITAAIN